MKGRIRKNVSGVLVFLLMTVLYGASVVPAAEHPSIDPATAHAFAQAAGQYASDPQVTEAVTKAQQNLTAQQVAAAQAAVQQMLAQQALEEQLAVQKAAAAQALAAQQAAAAQVAAQQAAQQAAAAQALAQQAALQQAAQQTGSPDMASSGGATYVDVSIDTQTLTYFVNGTPVISTPCVTGSPGRSTPRGVFAIDSLVPGKYLTGPTWHVWVDRWMRFSGNCGIHDANWRKSFGGDIYKHNGSHGCVNIPHDQAMALYNMVGIGTPVIVH